ncbi:MAG: LPS assembly protein LptD [Thermodesulfobacteriota bacterium]
MPLLLTLLLTLVLAAPAAAVDLADSGWKISADRFSRSGDGDKIVASGNVELISLAEDRETVAMRADWLSYEAATGMVEARGDVYLKTKAQETRAASTQLLIKEQTGKLQDATVHIKERNLHFAAREARKEGETVYYFRHGVFTSCAVEEGRQPMWSIKALEVDIDTDGFIFMKHCFLRIKGVPIFYLPIATFPGLMERQTGFIMPPEITSSSRSGYGLVTPFFIDLSPSADITLYPSYMEKRGFHGGAEFRRVFSFENRLGLQGSFLQDQLVDGPETPEDDDNDYKDDGYFRTRKDRYWIRGKYDDALGEKSNLRLDLDFASDRDFLMEFVDEMAGFERSSELFLSDFDRGLAEESLGWRDSTLQLDRRGDSVFLGAEMALVDEFASHQTPGQDAIHTLPHLLASGISQLAGSPVNFNWDADYVNYHRDAGVGLQRLDLFPRLLAPLPLGRYMEGSVLAGVRQTYYLVEAHGDDVYTGDSHDQRSVFHGKAEVATSFHRDFAMEMGSLSWLNHMIRPRLDYTNLSLGSGQDDLPDFDNHDRLESANSVGYGLDNHFRVGGEENGLPYNRYLGLFKVSQSYNFRKSGEEQPYSDVDFSLELYPFSGLHLKYDTSLSVYGEGIVDYDLFTRYRRGRTALACDYRYNKPSDVHELNSILELGLTQRITFKGELKRSLATDRTIKETLSLLYRADCWAVQLAHAQDEDDERVYLYFSLLGAGRTVGFGYSDDMGGDQAWKFNDEPLSHGGWQDS